MPSPSVLFGAVPRVYAKVSSFPWMNVLDRNRPLSPLPLFPSSPLPSSPLPFSTLLTPTRNRGSFSFLPSAQTWTKGFKLLRTRSCSRLVVVRHSGAVTILGERSFLFSGVSPPFNSTSILTTLHLASCRVPINIPHRSWGLHSFWRVRSEELEAQPAP